MRILVAATALFSTVVDLNARQTHAPPVGTSNSDATNYLVQPVFDVNNTTVHHRITDDARASLYESSRRHLLQSEPTVLMGKAGVMLRKPNYTLPACALSRKEGPFRPIKGQNASGGGPAAPDSIASLAAIRPVRILVIGMQSSGASTFLFLLGQVPGSVAVVDLWVGRPAPTPAELGLSEQVTCILLKATVNTIVDVQTYIDQYKPDASVLLLRHPAHNLKSISTKFYRDIAGSPGQKFIALEDAFVRRSNLFDLTIAYEDIFRYREKVVRRLQHKLGFTRATADCLFDFKRHVEHIQTFTNYHCQWCGDHYTTKWGYGNLKGAEATSSSSSLSSSSSYSYGSSSNSNSLQGGRGKPEAEVLDWKYIDKHPSAVDRQAASRLCPSTSAWYAAKYPDLENKPLSDTSGLTSTHQTAASKLALPTTPSQPTNSENFSSRVQMSTSTAKTRKERRQEVSGPVVFRKSSRLGAKAVQQHAVTRERRGSFQWDGAWK